MNQDAKPNIIRRSLTPGGQEVDLVFKGAYDALAEKLAKYKKALEFYAAWRQNEYEEDAGKIAREALGEE